MPGATTRRRGAKGECPRCEAAPLAAGAYAALLGYYLGDGCVTRAARAYAVLRVSCDQALPRVISDVDDCLRAVRAGLTVFHVRGPREPWSCRCHWKHWPCLFPQHGPGRKHERPIVLEPWQRAIVVEHPGDFLRGLFHSDGARVANWATRVVGRRAPPLRVPALAVQQPLRGHPRAVLLGARPRRRRLAQVQPDPRQRLAQGRRHPARRAHRPEGLSRPACRVGVGPPRYADGPPLPAVSSPREAAVQRHTVVKPRRQ